MEKYSRTLPGRDDNRPQQSSGASTRRVQPPPPSSLRLLAVPPVPPPGPCEPCPISSRSPGEVLWSPRSSWMLLRRRSDIRGLLNGRLITSSHDGATVSIRRPLTTRTARTCAPSTSQEINKTTEHPRLGRLSSVVCQSCEKSQKIHKNLCDSPFSNRRSKNENDIDVVYYFLLSITHCFQQHVNSSPSHPSHDFFLSSVKFESIHEKYTKICAFPGLKLDAPIRKLY